MSRMKFTLIGLLCLVGMSVANEGLAQTNPTSHNLSLQYYSSQLNMTVQQIRETILSAKEAPRTRRVPHPSWSMGAPTGFSSANGAVAVGLGLLASDPGYGKALVPLLLGVGFGDPNHIIGGSITVATPLINPRPENKAFDDGLVGIKLGHHFGNLGLSIGAQNAYDWGYRGSVHASYFGSASYHLNLSATEPLALIGTLGVGNQLFGGAFSQTNVHRTKGFGALALQINQLSFVVDYTAKILNSGLSFHTSPDSPVVVTVGAYDINEHLPRKKADFLMNVTYHHYFGK